ncbi:hypothetical protein [Extensimonas sp. H3M7-6]|uniref:hypothetical protein n=1 Tax=Extensimonas soli TaxID=3031322 RepID=UPI0023DA903F|nr:hypothetical protein [Extensimonas sp. H3M7-6]MDF1481104.1 hypothetical protein [Extensimonas sp. H3M7-6]
MIDRCYEVVLIREKKAPNKSKSSSGDYRPEIIVYLPDENNQKNNQDKKSLQSGEDKPRAIDKKDKQKGGANSLENMKEPGI